MGSDSEEFARLVPILGGQDVVRVHVEASVNLNPSALKNGLCLVIASGRLLVVPVKELTRFETWRREGNARFLVIGRPVILYNDCEFVFHGVFLVK